MFPKTLQNMANLKQSRSTFNEHIYYTLAHSPQLVYFLQKESLRYPIQKNKNF